MNAGDVGAVNTEILEYFKVIGILVGVVLLAFVALRFGLPKLSGIRVATSGPMRVVSQLTLEPRKTLYIIRAGTDYMMLAASDAGVQFLASLDAGAIEGALSESSPSAESRLDFSRLLGPRRR
jgi:flagellar biogenesis protein FliO